MGGSNGTGVSGWNDALQTAGQLANGNATTNDVTANNAFIQDPQRTQIGYLDQFNQRETGLANQAQNYYNQNAASPLNTQGSQQQMQAYNSLQNMANGQGPSLARANLQAGLNQTNQALQSQAMSSAGGAGMGNSQRNLLNAQSAAANNVQQQGQQASVAEQMGALQQQGAAANAIRNSAMAQQGLNMQNQQAALGAQQNAYNAAMGANVAQAQLDQGYQQLGQNADFARANVGIQGAQSGAKAGSGLFGFVGNLLGSDQNIKTDVADEDNDSVMSYLKNFGSSMTDYQNEQNQQGPGGMHPMQPIGGNVGLSGSQILPNGGYTPSSTGSSNAYKGLVSDYLQQNTKGTLAGKAGRNGSGATDVNDNSQADGLPDLDADDGAVEAATGKKGILGSIIGLVADAVSDENQKTDVRDDDNQEFMDNLESKSFRYKDSSLPGTVPGRLHGVMAQDMEKSKVGSDMVHQTPIGKMFNMPKAVSATLSGLATLNKRIDKLERRKKGAA